MSISGKYPVSDNMGELEVSEDGLYLVFKYRGAKIAEPSRLLIRCGVSSFSLGVPSPEGGELRLSKRISLSELRRNGIDRIDGASLVPLSERTKIPEKREPIPPASVEKNEYISFVSGGKRVYLPVRRP